MATGMEMFMKSLGIDPEQIKSGVDGIRDTMLAISKRLDKIDAELVEIKQGMRGHDPSTRSERIDRLNGPERERDVCDTRLGCIDGKSG